MVGEKISQRQAKEARNKKRRRRMENRLEIESNLYTSMMSAKTVNKTIRFLQTTGVITYILYIGYLT
jgi:hypothetical protein